MLDTCNVSGAVSPMPIVEFINGELMVSSVNVAKCFEKNHTSVLRGIRAALSQYPEEFTETNFVLDEYVDPAGRKLPMYYLTADAFAILGFGFPGSKASKKKFAYLMAFKSMRKKIAELVSEKQKVLSPPTFDVDKSHIGDLYGRENGNKICAYIGKNMEMPQKDSSMFNKELVSALIGFFKSSQLRAACDNIQKSCSVEHADGSVLEMRGPSLGSFHLLLLESLISLIQIKLSSNMLSQDFSCDTPEDDIIADLKISAAMSFYDLAKHMGRDPGTQLRKKIKMALPELASAKFLHKSIGSQGTETINEFNLISGIVFRDNEKKKISVTLSGFLSTLIGNTLAGLQEPIPFLKISMKEIRKIAKNSTLILHGWLSSQLQPKQSKTMPIDFLTNSLIWSNQNHTEICSGTLRKRKYILLNEILPDLKNAGWKCT